MSPSTKNFPLVLKRVAEAELPSTRSNIRSFLREYTPGTIKRVTIEEESLGAVWRYRIVFDGSR